MKKIILSIGGMSCSACSVGLEKYLNKQPGIIDAYVNLVLAQASITYEDNLTLDDINKFVHEAGFESLGPYDSFSPKKNNDKLWLIIFAVLSVFVLYVSMSHMVGLPVIPFLHMVKYPFNYSVCLLIITIPYLVYGFDIFKNGFKNLIHKTPNMDTLVSIGVLSSFFYSLFGTVMIICGDSSYVENLYYESSCIVLFFIKFGRYIDFKSKEKTKDAIGELVSITPSKALLKVGSGCKEVTIDEIKKGDVLVCKPGMKIAVDGTIISGESHFDEAFITGESVPVRKSSGDSVVAGSLNIDGYIEYSAVKIGRDSTISEIVHLVMDATNTRAPISRLADKVSGIFVPGIILISITAFIFYILFGYVFNIALTHFVTVLVVACPCALGLATPLAIVVSEGLCAKNGILVKSSEILENANKVDTIVFDKTGTLTYGKLSVSKLYNYSTYTDDYVLNIVSSLEAKSSHPIASAFSKEHLSDVIDFKSISGIGLSGKINGKECYIGNNKIFSEFEFNNIHFKDEEFLQKSGCSIIYVVEDSMVIGLIGVKDVIRSNSKNVISILKSLNKRVIMLTGDNQLTASIISSELGIDDVISNVMPSSKVDNIKKIMSSGSKVMMVGDGINDAPSLACSDVGVSISSGTDIANNSSDVILMNDNLMNIVNLLIISRKTIRNIKQNLFWAFFYNVCMIPLALGFFPIDMNPMIGGFAMTMSSITVMFNALRLKRIKLRRD